MSWTGLAPAAPAAADEAEVEEETTAELPIVTDADASANPAATPGADAAPVATPAEPAAKPQVVWSSAPTSGGSWPPRGADR